MCLDWSTKRENEKKVFCPQNLLFVRLLWSDSDSDNCAPQLAHMKETTASKVLCKTLEPPLVSLYFTRKTENSCSNLLKHWQNLSLCDSNKLERKVFGITTFILQPVCIPLGKCFSQASEISYKVFRNSTQGFLKDIQSSSFDVGCHLFCSQYKDDPTLLQ